MERVILTSSPPSRVGDGGSWLVKFGDWFFLAWIALIPVMQPFHLRVAGRFWLQAADVVFVPAVLLYIASLLAGKRQLRATSWHCCAILYLTVLVVSAWASEDRRQSFLKLPADAYVVIGALMTAAFVSSLDALRKAILAWLAGAAATIVATAAGVCLYIAGFRDLKRNTFLFHFGSLPPGPHPRLRALFLDGNMFCSYAIVSTMIVVAAREAGWIGRGTSRVLFWGSAVASILSLSPGLGGLFLAVGLWYWRAKRSTVGRSSIVSRIAAMAGILVSVGFLLVAAISPTPIVKGPLWEALRHPQPSVRVLVWIDA